ncbi:hypothetical protein AM1BK_30330 [Neobacillus kokaensis]|uniref:Uncharacterized protein n=1 Tax=Neobacillus kokaensis TaxID=2759023 RepID=A0ABQ3N9Q4_9BACI|nr:hypothetical protein AM1BK_30330 [Neobacillus kokaensis]
MNILIGLIISLIKIRIRVTHLLDDILLRLKYLLRVPSLT